MYLVLPPTFINFALYFSSPLFLYLISSEYQTDIQQEQWLALVSFDRLGEKAAHSFQKQLEK